MAKIAFDNDYYVEYNKSLEESFIYKYLFKNETLFIPKLSNTIDIATYSKKLHTYSHIFLLKKNDLPIGMCACYFNEDFAYITTISIEAAYQGNGLGKMFLDYVIEFVKKNGQKRISLEVTLQNLKAQSFYEREGFKIIKETCRGYLLERNV